jgi:short-subunit dehydrogenase
MAPVAVDAAVRLLARAAPDLSGASSSLGALAEEVGRSPYALQLVARILRQTTLDEHESANAAVDSVRERIASASVKPSLIGEHAPPGSAPVYRTIEAAIAETLRLELSGEPVRVVELAPGMVKTDEFAVKRFGGDTAKAAKIYEGVAQPLTAEDVAEAVRWTVTLPHHYNVDLMVIRPLAQSAQHKVHRVLDK